MCYDWELKHFEFVTEQIGNEKKGGGRTSFSSR